MQLLGSQPLAFDPSTTKFSTLRGTKFTELIATDCQSRAEEMLKEAQAPAHAFHTQLVDGCSSRFRTEAQNAGHVRSRF